MSGLILDERYYKLISNINDLNTFDLRTLNRYYLHIIDKRACIKCRKIFEGIRENYHLLCYREGGNISYNSKCKYCQNEINRKRRIEYRKDYEKFIESKLSSYKARAKELNVPFDIDSEYLIDMFKLQKSKCYYTNEEISFENVIGDNKYPHLYQPSLDRKIPEKGYVKDNVVWCSYKLNRMKNDTPYDEFIDICRIVLENLSEK